MKDLLSLLPEEIEELVAGYGESRYRADQILGSIYRGTARSLDDLYQLPAAFRRRLAVEGWDFATDSERARTRSADGLTVKLLLAFADGIEVETVLMRYRRGGRIYRSSACLSTQAGCAMRCTFCATGRMGLARNLAAGEIVSQALHFSRLLRSQRERLTHVTYMGMGEPLANYQATLRSLRILSHPRALGLSQRAITLSTVGLVRGIDRLSREGLKLNLAISLHAPDDELRRRLVPTAGPTRVGDLIAAGRRYRERTGRRVTYQYALIRGVNDSEDHARRLARLLRGSDAHVNLIPLNPTAGGLQRPDGREVGAFHRCLASLGVNATVRSEKGAEIGAACGQLRTTVARARPVTTRTSAPDP